MVVTGMTGDRSGFTFQFYRHKLISIEVLILNIEYTKRPVIPVIPVTPVIPSF